MLTSTICIFVSRYIGMKIVLALFMIISGAPFRLVDNIYSVCFNIPPSVARTIGVTTSVRTRRPPGSTTGAMSSLLPWVGYLVYIST